MIPFTQYKLPDGHAETISVDRPADIEEKANAVIAAGGIFEIEILTTGEVSMEVMLHGEPLAGELCENGPAVPPAVDRLVNAAYAKVKPE